MSKYIAVIITPLFLFACNQQANITDDLDKIKNKNELVRPYTNKELTRPVTTELDTTLSKTNTEKSLRSYTDEYYLYTYSYPSNLKAWSGAGGGILYSAISQDGKSEVFRISVKDPESPYIKINDRSEFLEMAELYKLSLKEYVQYIWQLNKNGVKNDSQKIVSEIKESTFNNQEAYQFNTSKNFQDENANWNLLKETTFLFTKINDRIFEIRFSTGNQIAKEIFSSLKVIKNIENLAPNQKNNYTSCFYVTNLVDRDRCLTEYARYSEEDPENLEACRVVNDLSIRDECYANYAKQIIYQKEQVIKAESEICGNINPETATWASCYWLFAMKTKDASLCEFIRDTTVEISKESCKNDLSYSKDGASWQLESGFPPYPDPDPLFYHGTAELEGWIVEIPSYVGDPEPHFHISDKHLKLLPPAMQKSQNYRLHFLNENNKYQKVSDDIIKELKKYSEQNPAKIRVSAIGIPYQEGTGYLIFDKTVEQN